MSAGVNYSHRSPTGNRHMRRLLNQAANAAVKTKGSIFQLVYRRLVPRLGHAQAIGGGEPLEILVDPSLRRQDYIEDCQVCCRPMTLQVTIDEDGAVRVEARAEGE